MKEENYSMWQNSPPEMIAQMIRELPMENTLSFFFWLQDLAPAVIKGHKMVWREEGDLNDVELNEDDVNEWLRDTIRAFIQVSDLTEEEVKSARRCAWGGLAEMWTMMAKEIKTRIREEGTRQIGDE